MPRSVDDFLDDLRRGNFHVDCVRVELFRPSDGQKFVGSGYIRQRPTSGFEIKIYAEGAFDFGGAIAAWGSTKAGVLFTDDDHFSLIATDEFHRKWKAHGIIDPATSGRDGAERYLVAAQCDAVSIVERRPAKVSNWVKLRSFATIKFPCNTLTKKVTSVGDRRRARRDDLNAALFDSSGLEFCVEDDEGFLIFASAKSAPLPLQLEGRITEALTFSLGIVPTWSVLTRSEGIEEVTRFLNHDKRSKSGTQWPPYKIERVDDTGSVWHLYDLYLSHVIKDDVLPTHPLSRNVFGVTLTRSSSLEGQALAAAVAVESVLDEFFPTVGKPDPIAVAKVGKLIEHIRAWDGDAKLIDRAVGSVGGLKRVRPDDRLRALCAAKVIGDAERLAWKKLRNTVAHGDWHVYTDELQLLFDLTGKVIGLFNQLVFHLIGYEGKQTDYGTSDWPTVNYPPQATDDGTIVQNKTKGDE